MAEQRKFDMSDYVDVAARMAEFRAKHPEGSLQPADLHRPFQVVSIGEQTFIVVVAAAYRSPEDTRPGIGMAYEEFPGRTPYTKGSELQNAETSAWGRAIVAVGAADTKRGIASAEDVRNRRSEQAQPQAERHPDHVRADELRALIVAAIGGSVTAQQAQEAAEAHGVPTQAAFNQASPAVIESILGTLGIEVPGSKPPEPTDASPEVPSLADSIRSAIDQPWTPSEADKGESGDPVEERRVLLGVAADLAAEHGWDDKAVVAVLGGKKRSVAKALTSLGVSDLRQAVEQLEGAVTKASE